MKKHGIIFLLLLASYSLVAQTHNLISGKYSMEELKKILIPQADWHPFRSWMIVKVGQRQIRK